MGEIKDSAVEAQLLEDARKRAAVTPFPGMLAEAFMPDAIQCGENIFVRRVVASDWKILQALDSPIIKQMLELQKDEAIREEIPFEDAEAWEMCWQFTHTPKQCRELIAQGTQKFREVAQEEMGDRITITEANNAVRAIGQQIFKSFLTALKYGTKDEAEKKSP